MMLSSATDPGQLITDTGAVIFERSQLVKTQIVHAIQLYWNMGSKGPFRWRGIVITKVLLPNTVLNTWTAV